jgi:tRNA threonylcarbamoyl adenosine modification protein (Sua5/YciO/YrdC/YwlC family)
VIDRAVDAIQRGKTVILPTDTVYGLAASAFHSEAVLNIYRLKQRPVTQPTAILTPDVDMLFELVPEIRGRAGVIARALLPGPYTLVLPNPARRFRWLTGTRPDTIGVRIPELPESSRRVVDGVGAVAATSANVAGGPDPAAVGEVPEEVLSACGAVVGEGRLPGTPSTVIDFTGPEPVVLREGPAPADDAIARAEAALAH